MAEFKFIRWRGGVETIRQNSIFKDFVLLAESPTAKRKHLSLLGTDHALKFLRGGRALTSVLSRNEKVRQLFFERFGDQFRTVRDYYLVHAGAVQIEDSLAVAVGSGRKTDRRDARRGSHGLGRQQRERVLNPWRVPHMSSSDRADP